MHKIKASSLKDPQVARAGNWMHCDCLCHLEISPRGQLHSHCSVS